MSREVTILLATYNGAEYLGELLDSLCKQTHENWWLWVRDDSSSDETVEIIREYQAKDARVNLIEPTDERLGALGSFARLMESAREQEYIMFCDQDDVWLPEKVETTLAAMTGAEYRYGEDLPLLVHTDLKIVDEELRLVAPSMKRFVNTTRMPESPLGRLLAQDFVTGCTAMANRSLLQASLPVPKEAEMHDYWTSLVAAATGKLVFVPQPTILYRQHDINTSGGTREYTLAANVRRVLTGWRELDLLVSRRLRQSQALEKHLSENYIAGTLLHEYHEAVRQGVIRTIWIALRNKIAMQSVARTFIFYALLAKRGRLEETHEA